MSLLSGIRVVEAASMVLVPSAAVMLADFGADVIKVEPPEGDPGLTPVYGPGHCSSRLLPSATGRASPRRIDSISERQDARAVDVAEKLELRAGFQC